MCKAILTASNSRNEPFWNFISVRSFYLVMSVGSVHQVSHSISQSFALPPRSNRHWQNNNYFTFTGIRWSCWANWRDWTSRRTSNALFSCTYISLITKLEWMVTSLFLLIISFNIDDISSFTSCLRTQNRRLICLGTIYHDPYAFFGTYHCVA